MLFKLRIYLVDKNLVLFDLNLLFGTNLKDVMPNSDTTRKSTYRSDGHKKGHNIFVLRQRSLKADCPRRSIA